MKELEDMRNDELLMVIIAGIQILRENERKQGYENGLGKAQTDSYVKGYEDGKADTPFTDTEEAKKTAYEQGLNDAINYIKEIANEKSWR